MRVEVWDPRQPPIFFAAGPRGERRYAIDVVQAIGFRVEQMKARIYEKVWMLPRLTR